MDNKIIVSVIVIGNEVMMQVIQTPDHIRGRNCNSLMMPLAQLKDNVLILESVMIPELHKNVIRIGGRAKWKDHDWVSHRCNTPILAMEYAKNIHRLVLAYNNNKLEK